MKECLENIFKEVGEQRDEKWILKVQRKKINEADQTLISMVVVLFSVELAGKVLGPEWVL